MSDHQPSCEEIAKKSTAWLMNPIEIDHSDPMGETKARYKQAEDMEKIMLEALSAKQKTIEDLTKELDSRKDYFDKMQERGKIIESLIAEVERLKHGVHCQDFPHCRKEKHEPFYGVLPCRCTACDCKGDDNARS